MAANGTVPPLMQGTVITPTEPLYSPGLGAVLTSAKVLVSANPLRGGSRPSVACRFFLAPFDSAPKKKSQEGHWVFRREGKAWGKKNRITGRDTGTFLQQTPTITTSRLHPDGPLICTHSRPQRCFLAAGHISHTWDTDFSSSFTPSRDWKAPATHHHYSTSRPLAACPTTVVTVAATELRAVTAVIEVIAGTEADMVEATGQGKLYIHPRPADAF